MIFIIFIVVIILIISLNNCLKRYKEEMKWKRNPTINIDKWIRNYNDEYRKNIDGEYYKEGIYWVLVNTDPYTPWVMCSKSKSVIRFAARCLFIRGYAPNRMHSSDEIEGKYLVDHAHAKRYTETLWFSKCDV